MIQLRPNSYVHQQVLSMDYYTNYCKQNIRYYSNPRQNNIMKPSKTLEKVSIKDISKDKYTKLNRFDNI